VSDKGSIVYLITSSVTCRTHRSKYCCR